MMVKLPARLVVTHSAEFPLRRESRDHAIQRLYTIFPYARLVEIQKGRIRIPGLQCMFDPREVPDDTRVLSGGLLV